MKKLMPVFQSWDWSNSINAGIVASLQCPKFCWVKILCRSPHWYHVIQLEEFLHRKSAGILLCYLTKTSLPDPISTLSCNRDGWTRALRLCFSPLGSPRLRPTRGAAGAGAAPDFSARFCGSLQKSISALNRKSLFCGNPDLTIDKCPFPRYDTG